MADIMSPMPNRDQREKSLSPIVSHHSAEALDMPVTSAGGGGDDGGKLESVEGDGNAWGSSGKKRGGGGLEEGEEGGADRDGKETTKVESLEDQAAKRRKLNAGEAESKKRGKRMFGVLMGTLTKFKEEGSKQTEASKRRVSIETRLSQKLKAESEELAKKTALEQENKSLRMLVIKKEDEISMLEGMYTARSNAKLSLAHHLCTSFATPSPPDPTMESFPIPPAPHSTLPHAIGPPRSAAEIRERERRAGTNGGGRPIYWLPHRLTRKQEEEQQMRIREVRDEVEQDMLVWSELKEQKQVELVELQKKYSEVSEEVERDERERRQERRRREEEAREREEEKRREKEKEDEEMKELTKKEGDDDDVSMADEPKKSNGLDRNRRARSLSRSRSRPRGRSISSSRSRSMSRSRSPRPLLRKPAPDDDRAVSVPAGGDILPIDRDSARSRTAEVNGSGDEDGDVKMEENDVEAKDAGTDAVEY